MPETPKKEKADARAVRNGPLADLPGDETDTWAADQIQHGYYYDDAHGFETYTDDGDEDEGVDDDDIVKDERTRRSR